MSIADKLKTISENVSKVYEAGIGARPSGSVNISENGTYDVTEKAEAVVNVPTYEEELAAQQNLEDSVLTRTATEYSNSRITELGDYALAGFGALQSINLPAAAAIRQYSAYQCTALKSFYAPLATKVEIAAFYGCDILTRLDFPAVTSISTYAFYNCKALSTLILRSKTVCSLGATAAFTGTPIKSGTGYIYVPDELVDSYKTATNWTTYASQIKPISELGE